MIPRQSIDGELTIGHAGELQRVFLAAFDQATDLLFDFAGVRECDAAGLQLICSLRQTAGRRGRGFRVAALSPAVEAAAAAIGLSIGELTGPGGGDDTDGL